MKDPEIDPLIEGEAGATTESEAEKRRRKWAERKREQRSREKKEKIALTTETENDWWARNRALLSKEELDAMQAQYEVIRDVMDEIELVEDPQFPEFTISMVTDRVVASVKEHGVAHLSALMKGDIPANWPEKQYWKEPALLAALEQEGPQTAQYIRYGILSALPDWRAYQFLSKAKWSWNKIAELFGFYENRDGHVKYR